MKTFFTLSLHLLISSFLWSQAPQGIPYQAVIRNTDGSVMASSALDLTFMIHDGSATGTVVYQESHALTSNAQGLVSCVVGNGVVSQGNFANINWSSGAKFLHVMMGTTDLGIQQMLSVPYALYSGTTNVSVSATGDTLIIGGNSVIVPDISAANPTALYTMGSGVTDIDGNIYPSIIINGQEWMQKNLAVTKYRNGDIIPKLTYPAWDTVSFGAYTIYDGSFDNSDIYGNWYNGYTVMDERGLCPVGWHVPNRDEWGFMINFLDSNAFGGMLSNFSGGKMKAVIGWLLPNSEASNTSGFSGLPSGVCRINGYYMGLGNLGYWWSSTEFNLNNIWSFYVSSDDSGVYLDYIGGKQFGKSVRCVRD